MKNCETDCDAIEPSKLQVDAGQAIYTRRTLKIYDRFVLGFSNRLVWKCSTRCLLRHYDQHVTANHLDVGVGTGYFLQHCQFPDPKPRVGLLDLNENALQFTADRIRRYSPQKFRCNIMQPVVEQLGDRIPPSFDSVGISYLLHCLPGQMDEKGVVFDHLLPLLTPEAVVFGSTLLGDGVASNFLARRLMRVYNQRGIFSNQCDTLASLERQLRSRFVDVTISMVGCCAIFSARSARSVPR